MDDGTLSDTSADEGSGLAFRAKNGWHRITALFKENDYNLPFPILISGMSAVAVIFFLICWFYITVKIAAIDFSDLALTPDSTALQPSLRVGAWHDLALN